MKDLKMKLCQIIGNYVMLLLYGFSRGGNFSPHLQRHPLQNSQEEPYCWCLQNRQSGLFDLALRTASSPFWQVDLFAIFSASFSPLWACMGFTW